MSVQLTVFPQWYDGVINPIISVPTTQMVSNPANFSAIQPPSAITATNTIAQSAVQVLQVTSTSMIPSTWYGAFISGSGPPDATAGGALLFFATWGACVLQKLSGMVAGGLYDATITWDAGVTPQNVTIKIFNNTTLSSSVVAVPDANNEATVQFTAPSTNNTIVVIDYANGSFPTIINSIYITGTTITPSSPIQNLSNGSVICDLYEDEDIPLTLSVDNFKNAAEQVQSYSKAFNLPATKRNNQIFDNMFEVTRTIEGIVFNPYVRTQAILKQDGVLLFEGFLRMIDISEKDGEVSYNVNLYSEATALADTLQDRIFADLDFTELEHPYNITQIQNSYDGTGITYTNPSTSGFRDNDDTVKYPFVDWNHQYTIDTAGNPVLPNLESAFRPFIQAKYLISRIFNATPFTFTSAFFDTATFEKLYMDFNWGSDNAPAVFDTSCELTLEEDQSITTSFATLVFDEIPFSAANYTPVPAAFGFASGVFTATENGQVYNLNFKLVFDLALLASNETLEVQWVVNGIVVWASTQTSTSSGTTFTGNFTVGNTPSTTLSVGDTILCQAKSSGVFTDLEDGVTSASLPPIYDALVWGTTSVDQTTNDTLLGSLRGELSQWDFLKGIMTMFNLVTMPDPDNPNNLLIEPYSDVFITNTAGTNLAARSIQHDWTDKIDTSTMKLSPLTTLNKKTIFKFVEDDDDFCFNEYKRQVGGHLYGSKFWDATDFTILTGEEEIIAEPFAATIPAQLMSQYSDFIIPKLYSMSNDETEGFDNSPRLMFNNGTHTLTSCTYDIPEQNGVAAITAETEYLRFSHLTDVPTVMGTTYDFNFGECQIVNALGATPSNNLFNIYWLPYYAELYNPDTRTMVLKVNLDPSDISKFKFNDQVMIKNRAFRVNKIDYKPNDLATVEFILIG
jgi:hypothetical protein